MTDVSELDRKINEYFPGVVVRKDLVKAVKGNAIVPTYVLEYLLGQYAASDDEATIEAGIDTVRKILADHYVHRAESELVKSTIKERGRHRIIDKVTVSLNDKDDMYEASFANLGISGVLVESATIKAHPKLLVGGVWCICDIEYFTATLPVRAVDHGVDQADPTVAIRFPGVPGRAGRVHHRGVDGPAGAVHRVQSGAVWPAGETAALVRLIPFVERNFNLVELGPKGTGKSHIYSEFSRTAC